MNRTTADRGAAASAPPVTHVACARWLFTFHLVVLDGVFSVLSEAGDHEVSFHEALELSPTHVQQLEATVQRRVLRQFARRGLLDEADTDDMLTWQGSGGFSVDASVRIDGEDRAGLERLVRYCARPPFALERLHALDGAASLASLPRAASSTGSPNRT